MRHLLMLCLLLAFASPASADDYPKVELKTKGLKFTVYLPDAEKGYYRGSRFDWSGVLGHVEFFDHKLFTPWKEKHNPTNHDDILGPVEEFGMEKPLGYDEAKVGETFLKIGVGELEKPREERYRFFHNYKIVKPGTWEVKQKGDKRLEFVQEIKTATGYGYRYRKAVYIAPEFEPLPRSLPSIVIAHSLKNTGDKPIVTDVYNHNFLNIDGDPVGPNYRFRFPFAVAAPEPKERFKELVELKGEELTFRKPLDAGSVFATLAGYDPDTKAKFILSHKKSGLQLTVGNPDMPISKFNFWAVKTTVCPELFLAMTLKPGEQADWAWLCFIEPD